MRKTCLSIIIAGTFAACNNDMKVAAVSETKADKPTVPLAHQPSYSSSFETRKPEYAAMIVQGSWKDWENNSMDNMKSWVADTIVALHSDNTMVNGIDSLQAQWKRDRGGYTSVIDTIEAVMPCIVQIKKKIGYSFGQKKSIQTARERLILHM